MRGHGLSLGKPFGIPVYVGVSTFLLLLVVALSAGTRVPIGADGVEVLSPGAYGAIIAIGTFISLLLHELSHCLAARGFGLPVVAIQFEGFGGFSRFGKAAQRPGHEAAISFAGPFANIALLVVAILLRSGTTEGSLSDQILYDFAITNVALAIFNLLPGLPLDGGRIVSAAAWRLTNDHTRGIKVAGYAGMGIAVALVAWTLSQSYDSGFVLYSIFIAWILFNGARESVRGAGVGDAIDGLRASELVRPTYYADPELPLSEALKRAEAQGARAIATVSPDGTPLALMSPPAVNACPEHRRPWVTVGSVSRALEPADIVSVTLEGDALLEVLRASPSTEHLVVGADGAPLGILTTIDVAARLSGAGA